MSGECAWSVGGTGKGEQRCKWNKTCVRVWLWKEGTHSLTCHYTHTCIHSHANCHPIITNHKLSLHPHLIIMGRSHFNHSAPNPSCCALSSSSKSRVCFCFLRLFAKMNGITKAFATTIGLVRQFKPSGLFKGKSTTFPPFSPSFYHPSPK